MGYIKLIVPVVAESEVTLAYVVDFYSKYIPAEKDAYGQTVEGTDVTEWYAQALDMDGKEVTYKVAAADASVKGDVVKVVYNTTTKLYSFAAATGYAFETDAIEYSATAQPVSFTADGVAYYYDAAKYFNVVDSLADLVVEAGSVKVAADETVWVVYTGKTANKTVTTVFYSDEASLTPDADILKGLYATGAAYSETTKINHLDKDGKVTATPDV